MHILMRIISKLVEWAGEPNPAEAVLLWRQTWGWDDYDCRWYLLQDWKPVKVYPDLKRGQKALKRRQKWREIRPAFLLNTDHRYELR